MTKKKKNPPTHYLKVRVKDRSVKDRWERVASGWTSEEGIMLTMNKGVTLAWRDFWGKDGFLLGLFPND